MTNDISTFACLNDRMRDLVTNPTVIVLLVHVPVTVTRWCESA